MKLVVNILSTKKINVIKAVTALLNSNTTTTTVFFLGNIDGLSWISLSQSSHELANFVSFKEIKTRFSG